MAVSLTGTIFGLASHARVRVRVRPMPWGFRGGRLNLVDDPGSRHGRAKMILDVTVARP